MSPYEQFFRPAPIEALERQPNRPLGNISDFVVEGLAQALEEGCKGNDLSAYVENIISLNAVDFDTQEDLPLAMLDLLMLETAITKTEGVPGKQLEEAIDTLAIMGNRTSAVTYEDVIFTNPLGMDERGNDPRLFTRGNIGTAEMYFYKGHRIIETYTEKAVEDMILALEVESPHMSAELIFNASETLKGLIEGMGTIKNGMRREDFDEFRKYLGENTYRRDESGTNLPGPSGLYSGSIPAIDILLSGGELPQTHLDRIDRDRPYHPSHQLSLIDKSKELAANQKSLLKLLEKYPQDLKLKESIRTIASVLLKFRNRHIGGVARHTNALNETEDVLPKDTSKSGTGGVSNVKEFLFARRDYYEALVNKLS